MNEHENMIEAARKAANAGGINLEQIPCTGCRYASMNNLCKRFPPIFLPARPVPMPDGQMRMAGDGWAFPPAAQRCGEYAKVDLS